jgi:hypothetical protein
MNKGVNSAIGGVCGALGAFFAILLISSWLRTGNVLYLGSLVIVYASVIAVSWLLANRYVKVGIEEPVKQ